jgi:hypothetical protein
MEKLTKGYLAGEKYEMKKGILPDPTDKIPQIIASTQSVRWRGNQAPRH